VVHRQAGISGKGAGAGFDFDKDKLPGMGIPGNNIKLSTANTNVTVKNTETSGNKKLGGALLAKNTKLLRL